MRTFLGRGDLVSFVALNKHTKATLTPLLYATISLRDPETLRLCLATISPLLGTWDYDSASYLASLVRSFSLHPPPEGVSEDYRRQSVIADGLNTHLYCALSRMTGLRRVTIHHPDISSPAVCLGLFRGTAASLEHLDLRLREGTSQKDIIITGLDAETRTELRTYNPKCPQLSSVKIYAEGWGVVPVVLASFFRRLFASHESRIHSLVIRVDDEKTTRSLLHESITWPALRHLELDSSYLFMLARKHMPRVRSLKVYTST